MSKQLDKNMISATNDNENLIWYDVNTKDFDLYGTDAGENDILTCRIPGEIAKNVNEGVYNMRAYAAGVRIRFGSDSPLIAVRAEYEDGKIPTCCTACGAYGFDLYKCNEDGTETFRHQFRPTEDFDCKYFDNDPYKAKEDGLIYYTLNLPYFSSVKKMQIGVFADCKLERGKKYTNEKPVIFYGSSITHGAAASTPGYTYENLIAQKYNMNYVNLGFAGNAKAEDTINEYMAKKNMCMFVFDYDHNAPNVEFLEQTHHKFYKLFRSINHHVPFIMVSRPDFIHSREDSVKRRDVITASYEKAVASGDKNVYFIDGETLMNPNDDDRCTIEGVHPNDLGFKRMAEVIGKKINDILKLK